MEQPERAAGLEKVPTGIGGFDEIGHGGLPRGRTSLIYGRPGTGKTVFALQVLVNGARQFDEPGIFVAFEENVSQLVANATSFGWDLPRLEREKKLFLLDARISPDVVWSGHFDLAGLLASVGRKAGEMGAKRVVFDSIDVLLTLMQNAQAERQELHRMRDWMASSGLTGVVTAGAGTERVQGGLAGDMQFMADCVLHLEQCLAERVAARVLQIVKYRGSSFEQNQFPFVIGSGGIRVAGFGLKEAEYPVYTERVSTGVDRLDAMLDGGYYRGSSVLVTGSPGTAKTTLAGAFALAACRRAERVLYVTLGETAAEIVRNLASVNIHLEPFIQGGVLRMCSVRAEARSGEEHLLMLTELLENHRPRHLVIDPLSAVIRAGGHFVALAVAQRLLHFAKLQGITSLFTSLLETRDPAVETAEIRVSTIADTWIHLSYLSQGGERNRALSILKARGIAHSSQVRELVLSDEGVTLADVYWAGGEVLMGTLRMEREAAEQLERERVRNEFEHRRKELVVAQAEVTARIRTLELQLEAQRKELELLERQREAREHQLAQREAAVRRRRRADPAGD